MQRNRETGRQKRLFVALTPVPYGTGDKWEAIPTPCHSRARGNLEAYKYILLILLEQVKLLPFSVKLPQTIKTPVSKSLT